MKYFSLFLILVITSCAAQQKSIKQKTICKPSDLAIDFLNQYGALEIEETENWVVQHPQLSVCVKDDYLEIMHSDDVIEADPILDAQDIPSELYVKDSINNLYVISDRQWKGYTNHVRVKNCKIVGVGILHSRPIDGIEVYERLASDTDACEGEKMGEIRKLYQHINTHLSDYGLNEYEMDESTEGGFKKIYLKDNFYVKVEEVYMGEIGNRKIEYYFEDGELRFVFDQVSHYNAPIYITEVTEDGTQPFDESKTIVEENRYYFADEELYRWIDEKKLTHYPYQEVFQIRNEHMNPIFYKYQH